MKSRDEFNSLDAYLRYVSIEVAKASVCVLLKSEWKDYKHMCRESHKIGEAFIATINKRQIK